jgi:NitT/TauT family transport system ATP-binding protein
MVKPHSVKEEGTEDNSGSNAILELRGIRQTYYDSKSHKDVVVFDDFNLKVEDYPNIGQFVVIMGKSGCGKSTILRYWTGLQKPTAGQVFVGGRELTENQSMPMVFQQYSSLEWYTVLDNVALPLTLKGVSKKEAHERAMEMIKVLSEDRTQIRDTPTGSRWRVADGTLVAKICYCQMNLAVLMV